MALNDALMDQKDAGVLETKTNLPVYNYEHGDS